MPLATRRPAVPETKSGLAVSSRSSAVAPLGKQALAHLLDIPFEMRSLSSMHGAPWNTDAKAFVYRGDRVPSALLPYLCEPYSWERLKQDEMNGIDLVASVPQKEIKLRKHQIECVLAIRDAVKAGRTGFLVADDVGLGKTMETWTAVMSMRQAETVLVVCPLAVVAHWRRTIQWMGDMGKRIVVINYDRLKKLFEIDAATKTKISSRKRKPGRHIRTQKGIARYAEAYEFDIIVWDESHKLRNPTSARSALARKLSGRADFQIWLSATAGQEPLELSYLSSLLAESSGVNASTLKNYVAWCQAQGIGVIKGAYGKVEWRGVSKDPKVREGADEDLAIMHDLLFKGVVPAGIRRTPTDIQGWPEINRILMPVNLDASDRALYMEAWSEFRRELDLIGKGLDSKNALVARLRFRQKASLLRTASTLDLALELLEQGLQVAISVAFLETLEVIKSALESSGYKTSVISGKVSPAEKEQARLDFQHGRSTAVLYTVEEGISLHQGEYNQAKRANIIHDVRWSGIQMKQIEGRTHRDGKFSQVYWMVGADTVEENVARVVASRIRSMSRMQGDIGTVDEIELMLSGLSS